MVSNDLRKLFPSLDDADETSPEDPSYNCFAWALSLSDTWVSPLENEDYYWPEGISREPRVESFVQLFGLYGFSVCGNPSREEGVEKIALYVDRSGVPTHAARQLPDGKWTSKLGALEDITHELDGLTGMAYGSVQIILRRAHARANPAPT